MTEEEITQLEADAIYSAVHLVRMVYDHNREDNDYHRGFMQALDAVESVSNRMRLDT